METGHAETVIEKAVAYVKDMFGLPPSDRTPDAPTKPEYDTAPELASEDAMLRRDDPHAYTFNKIVERSRRTSMDTEHQNSAAEAHMQAPEKLDDSEGSGRKARDDIEEISRGARESDAADGMTDGKSLPSDSEMEQAVERARE